jgi:dipeptidyl aminopeptidase/acylaminoacyl peptidase
MIAIASATAHAADARAVVPALLPVADFAKTNEVAGVALSPDGRTLAYQIGQDKDWILILRDWETGKVQKIGRGAAPSLPVWLNDRRVLYGRGTSVDRDGGDIVAGGPDPGAVLFSRFAGSDGDQVLSLGRDAPVMGRYQPVFIVRRTHVERFNTRLGRMVREADNPGGFVHWMTDAQGAVKIGIEDDGFNTRVLHRRGDKEPWRVPAGLDFSRNKVRAHALSGDGRTLYVTLPGETGRWGLHGYELEKQQVGELLLGHDLYDVAGGVILAPRTRELLGMHWQRETLRTFWFHADLAEVQRAVDRARPNMINTVVSLSDDLRRLVIFSRSARDPGRYFQFDRAKNELKPILALRPWVRPEQSAEMFPASFKSRDGLTLHGYLTVPAGREAKGLALVVLAKPELSARASWGYDGDVQFLANRGYAVLQVNVRGSAGYGRDFQERGWGRVGREVQADIADGARWAIAQGIADPARLAIMGEGLGGYAALIGVVQNPGLYRCAISLDGTVDWVAQLENWARLDATVVASLNQVYGDPKAAATELAAISPMNQIEKIGAPLLLINGPETTNSREAARTFAAALKRAGKPHEVLARFDDFDGLHQPKLRTEILGRVEAFLAQHMAAGAVATGH